MDSDRLRDRLRGAAAWLDATPSEVAGLLVLVVGGVAVLAALWWTGRPAPVAPSGPGMLVDDVAVDGAAPSTAPTGADTVTLHVAGAVARPGLVTVPVGARVADALDAAGGLLLDAAVDGLNLARTVADGERLDVPRVGDLPTGPGRAAPAHDGGSSAGGAVRADGTLDLNAATAADLEELPGVGPVLAERILAWRDNDGPFTEVGQLREVAGIGEKTFQRLAPLVGV